MARCGIGSRFGNVGQQDLNDIAKVLIIKNYQSLKRHQMYRLEKNDYQRVRLLGIYVLRYSNMLLPIFKFSYFFENFCFILNIGRCNIHFKFEKEPSPNTEPSFIPVSIFVIQIIFNRRIFIIIGFVFSYYHILN